MLTADSFLVPQIIQKLAHVNLQRILFHNRSNQDYYGRQKLDGKEWMTLLLEQVKLAFQLMGRQTDDVHLRWRIHSAHPLLSPSY